MKRQTIVTVIASGVTALAASLMISVDAAEARTSGWACEISKTGSPFICTSDAGSCSIGGWVIDAQNPENAWCDPSSPGPSDCCVGGGPL